MQKWACVGMATCMLPSFKSFIHLQRLRKVDNGVSSWTFIVFRYHCQVCCRVCVSQ